MRYYELAKKLFSHLPEKYNSHYVIADRIERIAKELVKQGLHDKKYFDVVIATAMTESNLQSIEERKSRFNTIDSPFDRYDYRIMLGNYRKGMGAKYKGRGFIQLTGYYNYRKYGNLLDIDLVNFPDLAVQEDVAIKILCKYFSSQKKGLDVVLNRNTKDEGVLIKKLRKFVNGGENGLIQFTNYYKIVKNSP